MTERTLAIGDIHGCDIALDALLSEIELTADDTLVVLGDVVDRGPGTRQALDLLLNAEQMCRMIYIAGNHEEMMLDALAGGPLEQAWLTYGGREALESYGGGYDEIPAEHIRLIESACDYWETETDIFVHANLNPKLPPSEQSKNWLRWARFTGTEQPHSSGKRVVCGHTPQADGLPAIRDGWLCLDTWVYNGLFLTCIDLATNQVYQAAQDGAFRSFALGELP